MFAHYTHDNFEGKKVAVLAQSDDAGTEWTTPFEDVSKDLDTDVVAVERFDLAAQSLAPPVLNLQRSGADVVSVFGRVDVVAKVLQEADKIGYHPQLLVSNIGLSTQLFSLVDPKLAQGVLFAGYFPEAGASTPGVQAHQAAMAKYEPDVKVDDFTMLGWASAATLVAGIEKAGDSLTCTSFLEGMESLDGFDTGLTPPITMSADDHQAIDAQRIVEVDGTSFKPVSDFLNPDGEAVGS
jgi:branched-chain amino acid transport system substrate-binding protein